LEQPQHALVGVISWTCADLAQEPAHGPPLPERVHLAELRTAASWKGRFPLPQHAVAIPVDQNLIGIGDTNSTALY
jgi:hypothetical protein